MSFKNWFVDLQIPIDKQLCYTTSHPPSGESGKKKDVYPAYRFQEFISALQSKPDSDPRIASYLINQYHQIFFSIKAQAVPPTMNVIAAGNIFLNETGKISGLSNEHKYVTQQDTYTLLYPFYIIRLLKLPIIPWLTIIHHDLNTHSPVVLNAKQQEYCAEKLDKNTSKALLQVNQRPHRDHVVLITHQNGFFPKRKQNAKNSVARDLDLDTLICS